MPMPIYLKIKGANQGDMDGSCEIKGHEKQIEVQALDHTLEIPTDTHTGMPTGQRVHRALTITKAMDKSSPKLSQACCSGEHLTDFILSFYRISPQGKEQLYYSIKLKEAVIIKVRTWMPNCLDEDFARYTHMEDVSFVYSKIEWTWEPDGISAEDDWKTPKS